ncbi:hypothetical protein ALSL_0066 [Aerosticca soli]|uniref:Uncharacterized protein n=1 Tax=Aerosticca soli TaxID=2010829 RepID=A0A2Z6E195_9GAMM|nr:hypothetical protein ALSL_0066 [Aerosticca soli]
MGKPRPAAGELLRSRRTGRFFGSIFFCFQWHLPHQRRLLVSWVT